MRKRLALEKALNQLREKVTNFVWSKVSIPLSFHVQSNFDFNFVFDHDNRFHTLMIHLTEPEIGSTNAAQNDPVVGSLELLIAPKLEGWWWVFNIVLSSIPIARLLGAFHTRVRIRTFNVIRSFHFSFKIPSKTLISF